MVQDKQVPRTENVEADRLMRLASGHEDETLGRVLIETLAEPSTKNLSITLCALIPHQAG